MEGTAFCESCGKPIAADARFCEHCGASQHEVTAAAGQVPSGGGVPVNGLDARQGFTAQQAAERIESLTPGAGELASQLAEQMKTPAVASALVSGSLAAAATFVIGVLLALALSDESLLGLVDHGKGAITAGFAQMVNFLQDGYGGGVGKLGPALFVAFPVGACAVAAATQAKRTRGLPVLVRLASGAGTGLVFGLLMLVPALAAGGLSSEAGVQSAEPNVLGAVLLGVLWGAMGGLLGVYYAARGELAPGSLAKLVHPIVADVVHTVLAALRPLAVVLVAMTLAGTVTWTAETLFKSSIHAGRSTLTAVVDSAAYGVDHGVHWTELGGLAQFRFGPSPVPVSDYSKIKVDSKGQYRVFAFNGAMPSYTFIPLLIFLIGVPLLLALYAGFAVARARRPRTLLLAGAWGCLVGPVWALALVIVNALIAKDIFGRAVGDSVFGSFLLGGLVVGAVGGLLSMQSSSPVQRADAPGEVRVSA